ncbi:hypothetical protein IQ254_27710 [Nodosilinea sp. LEGE 07088]|uniref:hypothetical protein n=1 Tax=Nodosilinea sp. LEGE 07088 TaxID=2777968 RepID=UPI00187FF7DA|nr:hypothetical protein [Nodosilinea sp. LEGE 07088]MBE9140941.1 hypothetical protein [Nodosilinea sp. LEGE 07088]
MSPSTDLSSRLQAAISLAQQVQQHPEARLAFEEIVGDIRRESPLAAELLEQLWKEYLASQRSSLFWEQLSQVEKTLSDRMSESHIQLKQNYLRLVQEQ